MNKTFLAILSLAALTSGTFAFADQRDEQQAKLAPPKPSLSPKKRAARVPTILNST